jgi:uncharacterized membrane protein YhiD involved in acid resistance
MENIIKSLNVMNKIEISYSSIILSLIISSICCYLIRAIYIKYGKSLNNKRNFSNSFILLGMTTTIVITVVKFSFALSLGLVGALSIVRFRAAIRDPEELVYLFLIIGIGISSGANQYLVTIFLTVASIIVILFQEKMFNTSDIKIDHVNLIQISCKKDDYEKVFNKLNSLFQDYTKFINLKSMTTGNNEVEISFEFLLEENTKVKLFTEELNKLSIGSTKISVISNVLIPE